MIRSRRPAGGVAWLALLVAALLASGCATGPVADTCLAPGAPVQATVLQTLRGGVEQSDPFARSAPSAAPRFIPLLQAAQVAVMGNDLFVADAGQRALLRVDRALQSYARFAPLPVQSGGLAVDRWSSVYIVEPAQRRVLQYRRDGSLAQTFADASSAGNPVDVVAAATDRVYVADALGARVVVFNRLGQVIDLFGERVDRPNPFRSVAALAGGPDDTLYVLDPLARRVHVLAPGGAVRLRFGESTLRQPVALAVDRSGRVFVADTAGPAVWLFEPARPGGTLGRAVQGVALQRPLDVWVDDTGLLYIADGAGGVLVLHVAPACPGASP